MSKMTKQSSTNDDSGVDSNVIGHDDRENENRVCSGALEHVNISKFPVEPAIVGSMY